MIEAPVLLLVGSSSRRLEAAATAEAARALCRALDHELTKEGSVRCTDCRRIFAREHPDVLVAAPESRRRLNVPDFEEGGSSKETTIPAALVRAVAAGASRSPYEAAIRVIVLLDADRTEAAAHSALLKVLEEPPLRARFLLTATRPQRLPPTILSRVVTRALPSSTRPETQASLTARGIAPEEAQVRSSFVPHDADDAAELDLPAARALRDALLEAAAGVFLGSSVGWALALADRLAGENAADTAERLTLLARLLRDAIAAGVDPSGAAVLHRERFRDLAQLAATGAARLSGAAADALELAASLSESTRNTRLAAEAYSLGLLSTA